MKVTTAELVREIQSLSPSAKLRVAATLWDQGKTQTAEAIADYALVQIRMLKQTDRPLPHDPAGVE